MCPEWVEAIVYRKDREHPVIVREYLDECYRKTSPWQSHTKRMLRHKALIQGYRVAFGFHGIYDPDEAEAIAEHQESPLDRPAVAERVAARLGVEPLTGEVIEAEATEEAVGGTETALWGDEGASSTTEAEPPGSGSVSEIRADAASASQIAKLNSLCKSSGMYEAEFASVIDSYGDFSAPGYGLTKETAGYALDALKERIKAQA